jgi:hypothetical protein
MKCFGYGNVRCDQPGTIPDLETPPIFVNPENPTGPTVRPVHCREHHDEIMARRDEDEESWARMHR